MKYITASLVAFCIMTSVSFAADKKLSQTQLYELRNECGKSAAEFTKRFKLCDGKGGYENHYNTKLNVCFIYMTASCSSDKGDEFYTASLIDVDENKNYASYIDGGKLENGKPAWCYVQNMKCKNLLEFQELIKPYMNE
jgi:hypothetical protein